MPESPQRELRFGPQRRAATRNWPLRCFAALSGRGLLLGLVRLGGLGMTLALACGSSGSPVVISEFVASNTSGLRDVDGETSDWIELHNTAQSPAELEGWCLTDDPQQLDRWCFPSVSIPAQGYLLVFASGKRFSGPDVQLHANFKLKASADYLGLVRPGGGIAQEFAPYPDQRENVAFGLTTSGARDFLAAPTPGAANR